MKKEVILVPKDKCPLDVLAEMGERTKNSWIFLHQNVYKHLLDTCPLFEYLSISAKFSWHATDDCPQTILSVNIRNRTDWFPVLSISASDIAFQARSDDPEEIFFLKMEE